jgi:hypothetical protein
MTFHFETTSRLEGGMSLRGSLRAVDRGKTVV